MIKHVIFDLGNVLVHIHPQQTMQEFAERCNLSRNAIRFFYLSDIHLGFMEGRYDPSHFFQQMMEKFPCNISQQEFFNIWSKVIGESKVGISELVQQLSTKYKLSVCSNTDPMHWQIALKKLDFIQYFQNYFLSFQMKLNKPDPEVFNLILKNLQATGEECVLIDDTAENIQVATAFGMHGILSSEPEEMKSKLREMKVL